MFSREYCEIFKNTYFEKHFFRGHLRDKNDPVLLGSVGKPFPTVKARIVSTTNNETLVEGDTISVIVKDHTEKEGNLHIQGPSVFKEYWNNPEATKETFTSDGWFITGTYLN